MHWNDLVAGLLDLLMVGCFFLFAGLSAGGGGMRYRGRGAGNSHYVNKHTVGGRIDYKHGQALTVMTWEQATVTGGGKTVYWDRIKQDYVNSKDELTQLTDYQKTLYVD